MQDHKRCVLTHDWPSWLTQAGMRSLFDGSAFMWHVSPTHDVEMLVFSTTKKAAEFLVWNRGTWGCTKECFVIWKTEPAMINGREKGKWDVLCRFASSEEMRSAQMGQDPT